MAGANADRDGVNATGRTLRNRAAKHTLENAGDEGSKGKSQLWIWRRRTKLAHRQSAEEYGSAAGQ